MTYHEAQDIGLRVRNLGYKLTYYPFIVTTHLGIDTFGLTRLKKTIESSIYFRRKHRKIV